MILLRGMKGGVNVRNWDKFRRMQNIIDRSVVNERVNCLFVRYYDLLKKELVKCSEDYDVFHDVFLKLTYGFNPNKDFLDQFRYWFKLLKGAYARDGSGHFSLVGEEVGMDVI